jgi:hypothetical protein
MTSNENEACSNSDPSSLENSIRRQSAVDGKDFRVALVQMICEWADVCANLQRMEKWAELAAKGEAQMIIFPELCISGICKEDRLDSVTESLEGPSVGIVRQLARRLKLAIGFGFSERTESLTMPTRWSNPAGSWLAFTARIISPNLKCLSGRGTPNDRSFTCWAGKWASPSARTTSTRSCWSTTQETRPRLSSCPTPGIQTRWTRRGG